jgi:hypothetical protein
MAEIVNHPEHYGGDTLYEAIKVIEAWDLDFSLGSAVKYIARMGKKPGADKVDDLKKARWYVTRMIEKITGKHEVTVEDVIKLLDGRLAALPSTIDGDFVSPRWGYRMALDDVRALIGKRDAKAT